MRVTSSQVSICLILLSAMSVLKGQNTEIFSDGSETFYDVVDLGTIGGGTSIPRAMNNRGDVVGSTFSGSAEYAVLFSGTGTENIPLRTLGPYDTGSVAYGINDQRTIVGTSFHRESAEGSPMRRATIFSDHGEPTRDISGGFPFSEATAINNLGQIVGSAMISMADRGPHAVLLDSQGGPGLDLNAMEPAPHFMARPLAINDYGQIVGQFYNLSEQIGGLSTTSARLFYIDGSPSVDLGTLNGDQSQALAINSSGQIVGSTLESSLYEKRAVYFASDGNVELESFGEGRRASATGINKSGWIVGWSERLDGTEFKPFIIRAGKLADLNSCIYRTISSNPPQLSSPEAINDWGQIACLAFYPETDSSRAVLLNPRDPLTETNGNVTKIKFVAGAVYNKAVGNQGDVFRFIDGTVGSSGLGYYGKNRDVILEHMSRADSALASGMFNLRGTDGRATNDVVAIAINYDEVLAKSLFGSEDNIQLGWLNPYRQQWELAVTGNVNGSANYVGDRPYDPTRDFHLGTYGIDTASNIAWAVIDHADRYAVVGLTAPTPVRVIAVTGSLDFGEVTLGSSKVLALTISNPGNSNVSITSVTGPDAFDTSYSGVLAPGKSQTVSVRFTPTTIGSQGGTVTIYGNSNSEENSVAVAGKGVGSVISLSGSMNYGKTRVGQLKTAALTIMNSGNRPLMVSNITYPTGFRGAFAGIIAPFSSKTVTVIFKPSSKRSYQGYIVVNSNSKAGKSFIRVSGYGN